MSMGVIVGLAVSVVIVGIAVAIDRMSRPGRVYPDPDGRRARGGDSGPDGTAWAGATASSGPSHHSHSDSGFHTGGSIGGHDGGFHTGGFDGGGSDGGGGDGGGGD